ncbi:hypothetical protein, partial [Streptomyces ipomoeae]
MADEAQHLTAAKPESASGPAAKPAQNATKPAQAMNPATPATSAKGSVQHAQPGPADKAAEQPRPKPSPTPESARAGG